MGEYLLQPFTRKSSGYASFVSENLTDFSVRMVLSQGISSATGSITVLGGYVAGSDITIKFTENNYGGVSEGSGVLPTVGLQQYGIFSVFYGTTVTDASENRYSDDGADLTASQFAEKLSEIINLSDCPVTTTVSSTDNTVVNYTVDYKGISSFRLSVDVTEGLGRDSSVSTLISVSKTYSVRVNGVYPAVTPSNSGSFSYDLLADCTSLERVLSGSGGKFSRPSGVSLLSGSAPVYIVGGSGRQGTDVLMMMKMESPMPINRIYVTWSGVPADHDIAIYLKTVPGLSAADMSPTTTGTGTLTY